MHDAPPKNVHPRKRLRRAEASLAALEMAMTAIACRATEAEYVYKEKEAVLQKSCQKACQSLSQTGRALCPHSQKLNLADGCCLYARQGVVRSQSSGISCVLLQCDGCAHADEA